MYVFRTEHTQITIDQTGRVTSLLAGEREILIQTRHSALVSLLDGGELRFPVNAVVRENTLYLAFEGEREVCLAFVQTPVCVTFEVTRVPAEVDALMFGPVFVTLDEVVGDVLGVCQGGEDAFGMQALNIKTVQGVPLEYAAALEEAAQYKDEDTGISVGRFAPSPARRHGLRAVPCCSFPAGVATVWSTVRSTGLKTAWCCPYRMRTPNRRREDGVLCLSAWPTRSSASGGWNSSRAYRTR
jgi:hypothetical protein